MNRFFKTFLLWFLIAVLPLHALATAMSMSCGPTHQKAMNAALQADAHQHENSGTAHKHHDDERLSHNHHHDDEDGVSSAFGFSVLDAASSDTSHKHEHSACSACSASCIGACAPPSAFHTTPAFDGSEALAASPAQPATGIVPAGLERPPRHTFA